MRKTLLWAALVAAILVAGWMVVGSVFKHNAQQRLETQPQVLEQTKKAKKAKRRRLTREQAAELCSGLQVFQESDKTGANQKNSPPRKEKAAANGFSLGLGEVRLDEVTVPKLPYGGVGEIRLRPGAETPNLVLTPNPRPFFEAMSRFRFEAIAGYGGVPSDGELGAAVAASLGWTALRTGRLDYGLGATGFSAPGCGAGFVAGAQLGFE